MRKKLFYFLSFIAIYGCKIESTKELPTGVYKMTGSLIYDSTVENTISSPDQFKIYNLSHYFYVYIEKDSSAGFGVGSYSMKNDTLIEHNIFNSISLDNSQDRRLIIKGNEKGYTDEVPELNTGGLKNKLKQSYDTVSVKGQSSLLDGLWERGRCMKINGTDTLFYYFKEYLVFNAGYYMQASRVEVDSIANTYKNNVDFGSFKWEKNMLSKKSEFSNINKVGSVESVRCSLTQKDSVLLQITIDPTSGSTNYITYKRVR